MNSKYQCHSGHALISRVIYPVEILTLFNMMSLAIFPGAMMYFLYKKINILSFWYYAYSKSWKFPFFIVYKTHIIIKMLTNISLIILHQSIMIKFQGLCQETTFEYSFIILNVIDSAYHKRQNLFTWRILYWRTPYSSAFNI